MKCLYVIDFFQKQVFQTSYDFFFQIKTVTPRAQ